jgi:prepilin-type processing-associated H-X9-DG protein
MNEETGAQTPPARTSGLAIAALILAILGLCTCVTAPIGLALGIIALVQMGRDPQLKGYGVALAAVIVSGLAVLIIPILAAIMFPVFVRAREAAQRTACLNNVKQISMALQMYAADYDSHFPKADRWNESLQTYFKNPKILVCPGDKTGGPSYGMNDRIGGILQANVSSPADVVSFFDSKPGPNQYDGQALLPVPPRHNGMNNVGFVDGHAKSVSDFSTLNWNPGAAPQTHSIP